MITRSNNAAPRKGLARLSVGALAVGALAVGMLAVPLFPTMATADGGDVDFCFPETRTLQLQKIDAETGAPLEGATLSVNANLAELSLGYADARRHADPLSVDRQGSRITDNPLFTEYSNAYGEYATSYAAYLDWEDGSSEERDAISAELRDLRDELRLLIAAGEGTPAGYDDLTALMGEQTTLIAQGYTDIAAAESAYTAAEWEDDAAGMADATAAKEAAEAAVAAAQARYDELVDERHQLLQDHQNAAEIAAVEAAITDAEARFAATWESAPSMDSAAFISLWMAGQQEGTHSTVEVVTDSEGIAEVELLDYNQCQSGAGVQEWTAPPATVTEAGAPAGYQRTDEVFTETVGEVLVITNEPEADEPEAPGATATVLPKVTA